MNLTAVLTTIAFAATTISQVTAHGYLEEPKAISKAIYGDMDNSGTCELQGDGPVTEYKSGEIIDVQWVRNNHIGGFIRFSLVPQGEESFDAFNEGAFTYVCREAKCDMKKCDSIYCSDDDPSIEHGQHCSSKIKLPDHLPAGDYTLQWAWLAAGHSYGNIGWSTGTYRSCAHIRLTTDGASSKPSCPSFSGGDRVTKMEYGPDKTDVCYYFDKPDFSTEEVKYSEAEAKDHYFFGVPTEVEQCGGEILSGSEVDGDASDAGQGNGASQGGSAGGAGNNKSDTQMKEPRCKVRGKSYASNIAPGFNESPTPTSYTYMETPVPGEPEEVNAATPQADDGMNNKNGWGGENHAQRGYFEQGGKIRRGHDDHSRYFE